MKKRLIPIIFLIVVQSYYLLSYDGLLFKPLTANVFEPRVGSFYQISDKKLRLDIGTSIDMADFQISENSEMRLGADFFTYTRLRSEGRFKFPVETSDYFFGINASFKFNIFNQKVSSRIRLAHISSHLVDGLAIDGVFNKIPEVYSREFIDLVFALDNELFRPYAGFTYIFSTIPDNVNSIVPQIGFDSEVKIYKMINLLIGYDIKLGGYDSNYTVVQTSQAGVLIKTSDKTGLLFSLYGYKGKSMHGMFFRENDSYIGLGFQLYFY